MAFGPRKATAPLPEVKAEALLVLQDVHAGHVAVHHELPELHVRGRARQLLAALGPAAVDHLAVWRQPTLLDGLHKARAALAAGEEGHRGVRAQDASRCQFRTPGFVIGFPSMFLAFPQFFIGFHRISHCL